MYEGDLGWMVESLGLYKNTNIILQAEVNSIINRNLILVQIELSKKKFQ